jgi:predicted outer membrane repeat protein
MGAYEFTCPGETKLFVDPTASGIPDGTSWASAFGTLNEALASACPGVTEIWVTKGTYKPTAGSSRAASFWLKNGLTIYGGFRGDESSLGERDIEGQTTVLSGAIATSSEDDNCYHVVTTSGTDATAVLDGFTITDGNNEGTPFAKGAGVFNESGNATLRNITFEDNKSGMGGAIYTTSGGLHLSDIIFRDNIAQDGAALYCTTFDTITVDGARFEGNASSGYGAGMYMSWSAGVLKDVIFKGNIAQGDGGGLYARSSSKPIIVNALFVMNRAENGGGMFCGSSATPVVTSATFARNTATVAGGGIFNYGAQAPYELVNTIVWENTAPTGPQIHNVDPGLLGKPYISYSLVGGSGGSGPSWDTTIGVDGGDNLDAARLRPESPALDMGDETAPYLAGTDLAGEPRILGVTVDMGAYELGNPTGIGDPRAPDVSSQPGIDNVYPNPFNPTVTITFELDSQRDVRVRVFDVQGKLVRTLINESRSAGEHRVAWDSTNDRGGRASSGVYFLEVQSGAWRDSRKVILLK